MDEYLPLYAATSLVDRADFDIPVTDIFHPDFFVQGQNGRYYPKFGPGQAIVLSPLAAIGRIIGLRETSPEVRAQLVVQAALFFGPLAVSALAVLAYWMWVRLGYSTRLSACCAIILVSTSELLPYSKSIFGNLSCAVLLFAAFYAIGSLRDNSSGRAFAAGAALGLSILVRPDSVLFLAPFSLYLFLVWRRDLIRPSSQLRQLILILAPFGAAAAALLLYNRHVFGSALSTGYRSEMFGFDQPLLRGLIHILVSGEKGFLVYSPAVVLSLLFWGRFHRHHPAESLSAALLAILSIYVYASWYASSPGNDLSYGQRFLLPLVAFAYLALPECIVFLKSAGRWTRAAFGAALVLSLVVQILGCLQRGVDYRRWAAQFESVPVWLAGYLKLSLQDPASIAVWWTQMGSPGVLAGMGLLGFSVFFAYRVTR